MMIEVLKSKIHCARVTEANLNYMGSITIDEDLLDAANMIPGEKVYIADNNNGERFETYIIKGERGSGKICLNGAAARKVQPDDIVIIMYEDYKYITIRGILFQFISLILMFVLVRNSSDLFAYVWITVISCSGANILNAVSRRKYCKIRLTINAKILTHLAPILVLFATSVATTIYTNADTTMLGFFSGNKAVGLYSVSTKIYTIVKQMLAAIIIVSIPRLSAYLGEKKIDYFNRTANQILNALVVIVVPAMVGLIALSKNIVFIIAGQEYVDANISLKILSVALLFSIFSWFYTSCILIPYRCENKVLMATIVAALVNIGLNFILIPTFQQNAAAFTTVIAELLSMVITWWYGRKYFRVSFLKKDILSVAIGCLAIWTICSISEKYISSVLISTVFSVTASVVIYMIVLLIMKNQAVKLVLEILHIKK